MTDHWKLNEINIRRYTVHSLSFELIFKLKSRKRVGIRNTVWNHKQTHVEHLNSLFADVFLRLSPFCIRFSLFVHIRETAAAAAAAVVVIYQFWRITIIPSAYNYRSLGAKRSKSERRTIQQHCLCTLWARKWFSRNAETGQQATAANEKEYRSEIRWLQAVYMAQSRVEVTWQEISAVDSN